jgi:predicted Zn finger-like uncharacterized protein
MSLATRCTACGTIFRIVEDQLRVSDGWVRCGRCAEIFDARELLFDIEQETPPPWPAAVSASQVAEPPSPAPAPQPAAEPIEPAWSPARVDAAPSEEEPAEWSSTESSRREPRWVEDADPRPSEPAPATTTWPPDAAPAIAAAAPMPEFMRRAENSARWKRPGVRLAMAVAATLLVLLLILQTLLHFRDALAAAHPPVRGGLQALCGIFGCEVRPWRRIEALSLESTSLNPVGSSGGYRLNLSLRNKSGADVAPPWVELSLTDAAGAPFARRVLGPEALTPRLTLIGAESEHSLSFSFSTGGQRVSGYSVNIFYP